MVLIRRAVAHAVATGVVVGTAVGLTGLIFLASFVWAVVADAGLGSPLALPFWLFVVFLASMIAAVGVLMPATLTADVICRARGWSVWAGIPVALVAMFAICAAAGFGVGVAAADDVTGGFAAGGIAGLVLLAPLGLYWWSLLAADTVLRIVGALLRGLVGRLRRMRAARA